MAKRVRLKKLVSNTFETIYPETNATSVLMADSSTVESTVTGIANNLASLQQEFDNLVSELNMDQIYITNDNNAIIYDSDDITTRTGLVAVY